MERYGDRKMSPSDLKEWALFAGVLLAQAFALGVVWTKIITKVNGLGGRVKKVEDNVTTGTARTDAMEKMLAEFSRDTKETSNHLARVEKGMDTLKEEIQQNFIGLGSTLNEINKALHKIDKDVNTRLVRVETIMKIEEKFGPLPPT
jgi:hypothetical protein